VQTPKIKYKYGQAFSEMKTCEQTDGRTYMTYLIICPFYALRAKGEKKET